MTPEELSQWGRIGAHHSWSLTADRTARTAPARAAAMSRFEREVDPDGVLDPADRARRAEHAKSAHFRRLAMASAKARRRRARADEPANRTA